MRSLTRIRMSQESRSSPSIMWSVRSSFKLVTNSLLLVWSLHERNEALPSYLPASSRTYQVGMLQLHAITAKGWHSPTGSRMQQVLSSLDVPVQGHLLSGHTAYSTAPTGAKLSDVQFGGHVDLCLSPSTSASSHEVGHPHTYPKPHT